MDCASSLYVNCAMHAHAVLICTFKDLVCMQVFDRAPELTPCGAGFSLVSNGFSAIEAISPDLLQHVYKHGTGNMAFYMHTADGTSYR